MTASTSIEAVKAVKLGKTHALIHGMLVAAGPAGLTSSEIEQRTEVKAHKRLPELQRMGKAKLRTEELGGVSGEVTRVVNGRKARVWVAA